MSAEEVINNLEKIGKSTAEKELDGATLEIVDFLAYIGRLATDKGLDDVAEEAMDSCERVGEAAAEKGLDDATGQAAISIAGIGNVAVEKGLEGPAMYAVYTIEKVGKAAAEEGLEDATSWAAKMLVWIGITAVEEGFEVAIPQIASSLAELTILSEEIVKTTIQDQYYDDSEIGVEDQDSLKKFMKIYEQEFEKLRAKK